MLSEVRLMCVEAGIYEFSALSLGEDEEFEDLSPRAKVVVLDMLATIRELQARLDDSEHGFKLALGDSGEYRRQAEELQARVVELKAELTKAQLETDAIAGDLQDERMANEVEKDDLEARVAELESRTDAETKLLAEVGELALNAIVETRISGSEFQDGVCLACKGREDDGHNAGCVWGEFVAVINKEMDDQ